MPRKARIDAPGALHHIIARGIERRSIFTDDTDRNHFLSRLETVLSETQTRCYAWALIQIIFIYCCAPAPLRYPPSCAVCLPAIRSEKHWRRFADYFAGNGYFNPRQNKEVNKKAHQLELPAWAEEFEYRIRKSGSMVRKKDKAPDYLNESDSVDASCIEEVEEKPGPRKYRDILAACGQATLCRIYKAFTGEVWRKVHIPYRYFKELPGTFIRKVGVLCPIEYG